MTTPPLRRGWTTGACAAAAAKAAWAALSGQDFPDPVDIPLPRGGRAAFALAGHGFENGEYWASIVKDAGDDPDVTHGACVHVALTRLPKGSGLVFEAGEGVGTITRPGLPLPPGEPAINPGPRAMIAAALAEIDPDCNVCVRISIPGGEKIAERTLNARLGIIGGLSILGTTGIVVPYSCAAWISSIHRGVDVARAMGLSHLVGSTGDVSERAAQAHFALPEVAMIDMGDFAGGLLKYCARHPVPRLTIAGGIAKMTKLAQGMLDLHSKRGQADCTALADLGLQAGLSAEHAARVAQAQTVAEALLAAGSDAPVLAQAVAKAALRTGRSVLPNGVLAILVVGRDGQVLAEAVDQEA